MPQIFPVSSYLGEMADVYYSLDDKVRSDILARACEIIEDKLPDMDYLSRFTWLGKQAFYNDEPLTSWIESYNHLKDNFYCGVDIAGENFILGNLKTVRTRSGTLNLFDDLLWPRFGRYRVPTTILPASEEIMKYFLRTKKFTRQLYAIGGPMIIPDGNLMSFYYRSVGKNFYNMVERDGMDTSLHSKFVEYIRTAIREGLEESISEYVGIAPEEFLT